MNRHPSDETLLDYCESAALPSAEQVRRHLESHCDRCADRIASIRQILEALRVPPLAVAPEALVRTALDRIAELQGRTEKRGILGVAKDTARRVLEEIRLGLVLDSSVGAAMQGIRGATTGDLRQLLFESPHGNLHLQIESGSGAHAVMGQLIPAEGDQSLTGGVVLIEREAGSLSGRLSKAGEFRIDRVPAGTVRIRIEWGGRALVTDPIDLEAGLDG